MIEASKLGARSSFLFGAAAFVTAVVFGLGLSGCGQREQERATIAEAQRKAGLEAEAKAKREAEFARYNPKETLKQRNPLVEDPAALSREHVTVYFTDNSHPDVVSLCAEFLGARIAASTGLPVFFSILRSDIPPAFAMAGKSVEHTVLQFVVTAALVHVPYKWRVKGEPDAEIVDHCESK